MPNVRLTRSQCANDDLPRMCAKCGREDTRLVDRTFTWCPGWVFIFLFFGGLLPLLIAYLIVRKKMRVRVPLCDAHAGDWGRASLFGWASVLGCIALFVVGIAVADEVGPAVAIAAGIGFFACLIAMAVWSTFLIRPSKITPDDILLTGVCREFADEAKDLRDRGGYDDGGRGRGRRYEDTDRRPRRSRERYDDDDRRRE